MSARLDQAALARLPAAVRVPAYHRSAIRPGIVHLGIGAFHRAHQAWYTEQVLNRVGGNWGIIGASLRSSAVRDQLAAQDGLYTVVARQGEQLDCQVIGAIEGVMVGPENPSALVAQLSHPDIRLVSLTITEKGYLYDPASDALALDHPDVRHDMANFPENPRTAIGYLAASLAQRRRSRVGGITLLSCDNLPHNGRVLAKVVADFIVQVDASLQRWVEDNVTFPCSMVDRIVPATTEADLATLEKVLGVRDDAAVFTEPFSQWVLEDKFARGAPDWQSAGALMTADVAPFETMKLRLLNGSHSLMAYLGYLAGYEYVHQVIGDGQLRLLLQRYMDEQAQPTLDIPAGFDINKYKHELSRRFANPALSHRTRQIAQDGSQKIPQRWLTTVGDLAAMGRRTTILALAVAGWIRYLDGRRDDGTRFTVDDPLATTLVESLHGGTSPGPLAVMNVRSVFGKLATAYPDFARQVSIYYFQLAAEGVASTVDSVLAS